MTTSRPPKRPLMEHLIELRKRLIWAVLATFAAFLVCLYFAKPIYNLLLWPYRWAAGANAPIEMIYTAPQEFFFTEVKLALFGAIFLAFPDHRLADLHVRGAGPL